MQPFIPEEPGRSSQSRVPSPPSLVSVKRHHGNSDCCSISQKKKKFTNFFCCPSCTFEAALSFILLQTVSATFRPSSEPEVHQPRETNKAPSSQITVHTHTHTRVRAHAHTLPCRILTGAPSPSERPENLKICLSFAFGLFPLESTQVQNPSLLSSTCQTKTNNNNNKKSSDVPLDNNCSTQRQQIQIRDICKYVFIYIYKQRDLELSKLIFLYD